MRSKTTLTSLLAVVASVLAPALPAAAGPTSVTGTVTHVSDGDTYDVSTSGGTVRVRMAGIQAMEIGDCHADAATDRLKDLILGERVQVSADDSRSTNRGRALRFTDLGSTDVAKVLAEEGLVFAFPSQKETARNDLYLGATRVAAMRGLGVFDDDACGSGPSAGADLDLVVKWDADGDDSANVNGEWVRITNGSNSSVPLGGWTLRDSALNIYTFPGGASVPANGQLYVHVGVGNDTATRLYWDRSDPVFENETGDGALLVDPHGDIRAHFFYPCIGDCHDPVGSSLRITANYDAAGRDDENPNGEWVDVENTGSKTVDLGGYLLESWPYSMELRGDSRVHAGETMRIHIGSGSDSRLERYWGFSSGILGNGGDVVQIRTFQGVILRCHAWGSERCSVPTTPAVHPVLASAASTFEHWIAPAWDEGGSHGFRDVTAGYQQEPVAFLAANGVTNGTRPGYYDPNAPVTRGQMAAFLWRLAGRPTPASSHGFTDLTRSWQHEPVSWLAEAGVTSGKTATQYAPDEPVTRGQMAAFLWRLVDRPTGYPAHGFSDVNAGYQQDPVRWLKSVGITNGVGGGRFGASDPVTRGQMAAFLHRLAERL